MCLTGYKSIIFITGLCPLHCFYCPVDRSRFGRDVMFVDDVPVSDVDEAVRVVAERGASGAAITGGDPLVVVERVYALARRLKQEMGNKFHIHLYTHVLNLNSYSVGVLASSDVDEVRIHATSPHMVRPRLKYLRALRASGISLGLEVPALPGFEEYIAETAEILWKNGLIEFVNINELDVSDANERMLTRIGLRPSGGSVVDGLRIAYRVVEVVRRRVPDLPINLCPSSSKDLAQVGSASLRVARFRSSGLVRGDGTYISPEGVRKVVLGSRELEV